MIGGHKFYLIINKKINNFTFFKNHRHILYFDKLVSQIIV